MNATEARARLDRIERLARALPIQGGAAAELGLSGDSWCLRVHGDGGVMLAYGLAGTVEDVLQFTEQHLVGKLEAVLNEKWPKIREAIEAASRDREGAK